VAPPQDTPGEGTDYIALAEVARPHGVRGELKLRVYNPESDLLQQQRGAIRLVSPTGEVRQAKLRSFRKLPGGDLLAHMDGVGHKEAAEALRGWRFEVPREALAPTQDADEFYVVDLQGCQALLGDEVLGTVVEVLQYPTCDVLVVDRDGNRKNRLEIPFLAPYVGAVSVADKRVEILSVEDLT